MTRSKSDAQLDAEAAARPIFARRLTHAPLLQWQAAYSQEPPMRTNSSHPQLIVDEDEGIIEASQVGVDFTAALIEYVDASFPTHPGSSHVGARGRNPLHDGLILWDRECRRRHARWPDHRGRAVCAEIAWLVLRDRTSLQYATEQTGVSWTRGERLLLEAVHWMRRKQERWMSDHLLHDRATCRLCRDAA